MENVIYHLLEEQLQKHAVTHIRRKTFNCTYCEKGFVRGDHLKMHERTCKKYPERKIKVGEYSAVMQVSGGVDNAFNLLEYALGFKLGATYFQM